MSLVRQTCLESWSVTLVAEMVSIVLEFGLFFAMLAICGWLYREVFLVRSRNTRVPVGTSAGNERSSTVRSPSQPFVKPRVKEPSTFDGNGNEFKEWVYAMDLSLSALSFDNSKQMVDYASSYLVGNARPLWIMSRLEAGVTFSDWPALKDALAEVFSPPHEQERA